MPRPETDYTTFLPDEILTSLFIHYLSPEDVAFVGAASSRLYRLATANLVWQSKLASYFPKEYRQLTGTQTDDTESQTSATTHTTSITFRVAFFALRTTLTDKYLKDPEKQFFIRVKNGRLSEVEPVAAAADAATTTETVFDLSLLLVTDKRELTAVHWAANLGYQQLLDTWYHHILEQYRNDDGELDFNQQQGENKRTLLYWMVALNQCSALHETYDVWQTRMNEDCDKDHAKPLHVAAEYGHAHMLDDLLGKGANPNSTNCSSDTPPHTLIKYGHLPLLEATLQRQDTESNHIYSVHDIGDYNKTWLHLAASEGKPSIVRWLLSLTDETGDPVIDINVCNEHGDTPLHYTYKYPIIVKILLAHTNKDRHNSCDINAANAQGMRPLHYVAYGGFATLPKPHARLIMRLLLEHTNHLGKRTCDVNATDNQDRTPLHNASKNAAVRLLLAHGANTELKATLPDEPPRTAEQIAKQNEQSHRVEIFQWHKATREARTPHEKLMAALGVETPSAPSRFFKVSPKSIFHELYDTLAPSQAEMPLQHIQASLREKCQYLASDNPTHKKFKRFVKYIDEVILTPAITAEIAENASATAAPFAP